MTNRHTRAVRAALVGLALATAASPALAQGQWIVRSGVAHASPNDSSGPVLNDSNNRVGVDGATSLGLTMTYMVDQHWAVELLASYPFKHDIQAEGNISGIGKAGETKHLPPTLYGQRYWNPAPKWHLYGGVGVNYTTFFDEKPSASLETALGQDVRLDLDDSVGVAVNAGADYDINARWFANLELWYVDIETTATISDTNGNRLDQFDVTIDPVVVMLGAGYRF